MLGRDVSHSPAACRVKCISIGDGGLGSDYDS